MYSLILLSVVGCSIASPFLHDTPEVVAEKQRFVKLWNAQAAAAAAAPDPVPSATSHAQRTIPHHVPRTPTPQHNPAWTSSLNHVPATPPQQHFVPRPPPRAQMNVIPAPVQKWTGPVAATVPAGVNGKVTPVGETQDVAAARDAFFASYTAALGATLPARPQPSRHVAAVPRHSPRPAAPVQRWSAPVAAPVQRSFGHVGEVADIGAATAAFEQAYKNAATANIGRF